MSKTATVKPPPVPTTDKPKILRVSPEVYQEIKAAGKPFGFSAQRSFDLIMGSLFPYDPEYPQDRPNEIKIRLAAAVSDLVKESQK